MTIYNAEPFLRISIDSLLAQSFRDWELIAVENGSTDGSSSILAGYSDARIRVFQLRDNIGRTPALRYALEQARGDCVAVLDADDIAHQNRFERQIAFMDEHPEVAIVGSWVRFIDDQGRFLSEFRPPVDEAELRDCLGWIDPIVHSSAMYRRKLALQVGGYPEDLVYAQDFGLILALAQHSKIAMIGDYLCQWRDLRASMTRSPVYQLAIGREALILLRRAADTLPLSSAARRLNRRTRAIAEIKLGIAMIRAASLFKGLKTICLGVCRDPFALVSNGSVRRLLGNAAWRSRFSD
jgi:glycosyltransferase involved in cell wall biosynthesis